MPVLHLAGGQGVVHGLAHAFVRRVQRPCLLQRLAFDQPAHPVDVNDVGNGGGGHGDPAVGFMPQQAFLDQRAEDLPQGVARDVQLLAQRGFRQALPGAQLAVDQLLADALGHGIAQARGFVAGGVTWAWHGRLVRNLLDIVEQSAGMWRKEHTRWI